MLLLENSLYIVALKRSIRPLPAESRCVSASATALAVSPPDKPGGCVVRFDSGRSYLTCPNKRIPAI